MDQDEIGIPEKWGIPTKLAAADAYVRVLALEIVVRNLLSELRKAGPEGYERWVRACRVAAQTAEARFGPDSLEYLSTAPALDLLEAGDAAAPPDPAAARSTGPAND